MKNARTDNKQKNLYEMIDEIVNKTLNEPLVGIAEINRSFSPKKNRIKRIS